ncbi:hypothetical protein OIU77_023872 [Salix suchowensis]|uniref:Laccase n=1 Tax=Salix suchowensis TaxID=1278906 RepID=A0ABQ9C686_9ROSI|nr:hypothetical protein OIU77_023872 [Salix suchowensis]
MAAEILRLLGFIVSLMIIQYTAVNGKIRHHKFVVKSAPFTRLCSAKEILTVNGKFPGPTLEAHAGDELRIAVHNRAKYNITLHWHGARQVRNPWSDGPEYITQCPIQPGRKFKYRIRLSREEGTIWWHAHSSWARATVHGALVIYPKPGSPYPFPKPHAEIPIILGEWWKKDVMKIPGDANITGGTFKVMVEQGKTYLLRIVNAVMDENLFFVIAKHKLTITSLPATISMASRAYSSAFGAGFDNTTATAVVEYHGIYQSPESPHFAPLPPYNGTQASTDFTEQFRSPVKADVPQKVDTHLLFAISVNLLNCSADKPCAGPFGKRFAASLNNISFVERPSLDILQAYYYGIDGVFERNFPRKPPYEFNYTAENLPANLLTPSFGTEVRVLEYNASVEIVLQGTNVLAADNHPIHLHGYSFYVVGWGLGNFDPDKDPLRYNLVDPPEETTVGVPHNGWAAIRFRADNPGVWLLHCHIERHVIWGMGMVFIVKNGASPRARILKPPRDLPEC